MDPEQLDTIFPLKLPLLLNKLPLSLLTQRSAVLDQNITVLFGTLWRNTLIDQLL